MSEPDESQDAARIPQAVAPSTRLASWAPGPEKSCRLTMYFVTTRSRSFLVAVAVQGGGWWWWSWMTPKSWHQIAHPPRSFSPRRGHFLCLLRSICVHSALLDGCGPSCSAAALMLAPAASSSPRPSPSPTYGARVPLVDGSPHPIPKISERQAKELFEYDCHPKKRLETKMTDTQKRS